jgi:hypothetical protein
MDIKAALSTFTMDSYREWLASPEGWDRWACGLVLTDQGPMPMAVAVIGTAVVVTQGTAGINIHPHADAATALACWGRLAAELTDQALIMSQESAPADQPAQTLALPVSTDEPTARPFGWV